MLTEKEVEVLKLQKAGLTQLEIAKKLGISQPAVSNFYKNIARKIKEAEELLVLNAELETGSKAKRPEQASLRDFIQEDHSKDKKEVKNDSDKE